MSTASGIKISIITVSFNAAETIRKSIESVIDQHYQNIEYIIVDGNSSDGTTRIIEEYTGKIAHYISEPDRGIFHAMNKGIRLASGDFIYFLGADDYLMDQNVINEVATYLSRTPECKFMYGNIQIRCSTKEPHTHKPAPPDQLLSRLLTQCLPHQASFIHASLFGEDQIGLYSEQYKSGSDYEWQLKLVASNAESGKQIRYYDRTIASYNTEGTSGKIETALKESFDIQNTLPVYQQGDWLKRRIIEYQKILVSPNGQWNLFRIYPSDDRRDMVHQIAKLEAALSKANQRPNKTSILHPYMAILLNWIRRVLGMTRC